MATATELQQLYVAYFGRPADPAGLDYWVSSGISTKSFAAVMFAQPEFQSVNSGLSVETQVNQLYINLFGRNADATGLLYWTNQINTGQIALASVANDLIFSATNSGAASAADLAALTNKTSTAVSFTAELRADDDALRAYLPQSTSPWISGASFAAAVSFMTTATAANIPTAAQITASVDGIGEVGTVGKTFTLTAGIDTVTGTTAADTINAGMTDGGEQTLQGLDTINGGDGTDKLNVVFGTAGTYAPTLTSIETVNLSSTVAVTLDLVGAASVTSVLSTGSTGAVIVNNIAGPSVAVTIASTAVDHTLDYSAVTGTADAATVTVRGMTAGTLSVDTDVETINLVSAGSANTLTALTSGANVLNISGSQDITITAANTTSETINASAATGDVTLTSNNVSATSITTGAGGDAVTLTGSSAVTETVSTGAGDDTVTFTANLADADVLDGGAGDDTLVGIDAEIAALTSTATTSNITNFEAITISDDLDGNIDVSDVQESGIATITLGQAGAGIQLVNGAEQITGEAGTFTVNLGASAAANVADINGTLTVVDSGTATTDSLIVNNTTANTTTNLRLDVFDGESLTSTGYENVTFNTGTVVGSNVEQAIATLTITPDSVTADVSFTATGGNALDIATSITSTSTGALTIDASGMTAQASGTTTFDVAAVVLGTSGTITATGSAGDDIFGASGAVLGDFVSTINAGAGDDAIYTGSAIDTVNGGAGADIINVGSGLGDSADGGAGDDVIVISADANLTSTDTYVGGDGTDAILFAANITDAAATLSRFSGFETLRLNPGAAESITMSNFLNNQTFTTIEFGAADTNGATMAVTNATAAVTNIRLGTTDAAGTAVAADDDVTFDRLVDTSADSITITHDSGAAAGTIDALIVDDEETINITTDSAADDLTITAMDSADATSIVLSGAGDITITAFTAAGDVPATINGSVMTGAMTVSAGVATASVVMTAGTGGSALTGGAGADTITGGSGVDTLIGGAGIDTISGGAGDDAITGGFGADSLTGGTGVDNYFQTYGHSVAATSLIDASTGNAMAATVTLAIGDTITFGNGVDVITDFTAGTGGDTLTALTATAATSALAVAHDTLAAADDILFLSGAFDTATGIFTIAADGDGADTMILDIDQSVTDEIDLMTGITILIGVDSDDLVAGNII